MRLPLPRSSPAIPARGYPDRGRPCSPPFPSAHSHPHPPLPAPVQPHLPVRSLPSCASPSAPVHPVRPRMTSFPQTAHGHSPAPLTVGSWPPLSAPGVFKNARYFALLFFFRGLEAHLKGGANFGRQSYGTQPDFFLFFCLMAQRLHFSYRPQICGVQMCTDCPFGAYCTHNTCACVLSVPIPTSAGLLEFYDAPHSLPCVAPRPLIVVSGAVDLWCPLAGVTAAADAAKVAYTLWGKRMPCPLSR